MQLYEMAIVNTEVKTVWLAKILTLLESRLDKVVTHFYRGVLKLEN